MEKAKRELTPREELFCQLYCNLGSETFSSATKAAREAKYSERFVGQTGSKLLKKSKIRARVRQIQSELLEKTGLTGESVILGILHDQEMARNKKEYSVSNACSKLLGETIALFKQRSIIDIPTPDIPADEQTPEERAATREAANVFKLKMAGGMK